jgi:hypothetical protein
MIKVIQKLFLSSPLKTSNVDDVSYTLFILPDGRCSRREAGVAKMEQNNYLNHYNYIV